MSKKSEILMKRLTLNDKISISSEKLEQLPWDFQERCELKSKVTKKQGITLSQSLSKLIKIWSKRKHSEMSEFSI